MEDTLRFEEALKRLEELTKQLETGEGTLEEMIERYETGMRLVKLCNERLDAYEKKITMLSGTEQT
ncbi:MAG: exodeoxyribonuclease VII small subunit [Clostridia bacterium]|nr:exodeoxyribonuclease VII small subunit [Clostridia bacterium]